MQLHCVLLCMHICLQCQYWKQLCTMPLQSVMKCELNMCMARRITKTLTWTRLMFGWTVYVFFRRRFFSVLTLYLFWFWFLLSLWFSKIFIDCKMIIGKPWPIYCHENECDTRWRKKNYNSTATTTMSMSMATTKRKKAHTPTKKQSINRFTRYPINFCCTILIWHLLIGRLYWTRSMETFT